MTWHPLVVLVDLQTIFLQPIEELFDSLLGESNGNTIELLRLDAAWIKRKTQLLYTRDYNTVTPQNFNTGYETSLLVFQPSQPVFDDSVSLLLSGHYDAVTGWGGLGLFAGYTRARITSGLLPYYYEHVRGNDGSAVELSRCVYGNKNDGPMVRMNDKIEACRDGTQNCVDCRLRPFEDVRVALMSVCRSPWTCFFHHQKLDTLKLCRWFHVTWFQMRKELEDQRAGEFPPVQADGQYWPKHFLGFCKTTGLQGYTPMGIRGSSRCWTCRQHRNIIII